MHYDFCACLLIKFKQTNVLIHIPSERGNGSNIRNVLDLHIYFNMTDFAVQCYECTNPPEVSGGTECDSDGKINCPKSYDRCMTMKYTMSLGQSGLVSVEHRSCSNDPSCDPKNQLFSKSKIVIISNYCHGTCLLIKNSNRHFP